MAEKSMKLKKELQGLVKEIVDEDDDGDDRMEAAIKMLDSLKDLNLSAAAVPETGESSSRSSLVIPAEFRCPISEELMEDPVLLETGQTYDRKFIQKWFHKGHDSCPRTKEVLSDMTLTPNHLIRRFISRWCKGNGLEPPDVAYEEVPIKSDKSLLNELLQKMLSSSLSDQKEAAKELRLSTKWDHSFRAHFAKCEASVQRLLHPLKLDCINEHPDLQVDIITTVLNLSIHDDNKRIIIEDPLALLVLIKSLEYGTIETKANAAATIFALSSPDSNKTIIGRAGALKPLIALLEEGQPATVKDAASAIFNICLVLENKGRAVCDGAVAVLMKNITEHVLVDELVCLLALLSTDLKAIGEMCKLYTVPCMLQIIRETDSQCLKENCVSILYAICVADRTKLREIQANENAHHTISQLAQTGNTRARRKAAGILEKLNRADSIIHTT